MCGKMSVTDHYQVMNRRILLTILGAVFLGLIGGCMRQFRTEQQGRECTRQLFAMDTFMSFTAYGKNSEEAVEAAMKEVQRLDALLSAGDEDSEVFQINRDGSGTVSEDTGNILKRAMEIYEATDGLFDFTVYPLMELWGFTSQEYHVPSEEELSEVLPLVNASKIRLDGTEVTLGKGQRIDFGGIAKGYTSARIMDIFRKYGVVSGMVSLGGNVQVLGTKPDGSEWQIGIQDPDSGQGEVLAVLAVEDKAVITSGGYERYFEEDGNTYIHIIDPRTGYPADAGLISVTIVSEDGTLADALSTSFYIMGLDDAVTCWRSSEDDFDMVLVRDNGEIFVTEGISSAFRTNEEVTILYTEKR